MRDSAQVQSVASGLYDTDDVSRLLRVNVQTARRMCRAGVLPSVKIGRRYYVPAARLDAFINEGVGR